MPAETGSRIQRLHDAGREKGISLFLLSSPASVLYYSGYFFYFEHGSSPFHLLPAVLVTGGTGPTSLLIADNELAQAEHANPTIHITPYASYTFEEPLHFEKDFAKQLLSILSGRVSRGTKLGIEKQFLPFAIGEALQTAFPDIILEDIGDTISQQRIIKDADEIENIRKAAALCDAGQQAVLQYAREGQPEVALFSIVRRTLDEIAGTRVPLMADLVSGPRTASGGGIPSAKKMYNGELLLSDLTPCLNGYWGDSCNTIAIGKPSADQQKIFSDIKRALDSAIRAIMPGVKASQIDTMLRIQLGSYGHHSGHGVGIAPHEEPRIVPYNDNELQEGMVIALDPAVYTKAFGIRLEHLVLVTEMGCELLTRFDHQLERI